MGRKSNARYSGPRSLPNGAKRNNMASAGAIANTATGNGPIRFVFRRRIFATYCVQSDRVYSQFSLNQSRFAAWSAETVFEFTNSLPSKKYSINSCPRAICRSLPAAFFSLYGFCTRLLTRVPAMQKGVGA